MQQGVAACSTCFGAKKLVHAPRTAGAPPLKLRKSSSTSICLLERDFCCRPKAASSLAIAIRIGASSRGPGPAVSGILWQRAVTAVFPTVPSNRHRLRPSPCAQAISGAASLWALPTCLSSLKQVRLQLQQAVVIFYGWTTAHFRRLAAGLRGLSTDPLRSADVLAAFVVATVATWLTVQLVSEALAQRRAARAASVEKRTSAEQQIAIQKQRISLALEDASQDLVPEADQRTFASILEDYRWVLNSKPQTLDEQGLSDGQAQVNPSYHGKHEQWSDFVQQSKLPQVREEAWWDMQDAVQAETVKVTIDNIDWDI